MSRRWLIGTVLAALLLNGLLAFENWWPTPAIRPLAQLAPEFLGLWLLLLVIAGRPRRHAAGQAAGQAAVQGAGQGAQQSASEPGDGAPATAPLSALSLTALAAAYLLLSLGRYIDVTSPALYGRRFSWYWDGPHLPGLLAGATATLPALASVTAGVVICGLLLAVLLLLRRLIARLAEAAVAARRSRPLLGLTAAAVLLVAGSLAGVSATWPWVSPAVSPGWWQQARLVWLASRPDAMAASLPASPHFDSDLSRVRETDVVLIFVESMGAATIDDPELARALQAPRRSLARAIANSGMTVVSSQVRSPTFGGGSWLAHAALLSGIDTADPARYPLLMASERDNLVRLFARHGHRTISLQPGLQAPWPEGRFYNFDQLLDAEALAWRGPAFGFWRIPDQYSLARLDAGEAVAVAGGEHRPRFVVFATISSHLPFDPVPPLQPDWDRLLGDTPFDSDAVDSALDRRPDWLALREPYLRSLSYSLGWLSQWLQRPAVRERLVIVVGDHQPAASVAGRDASWNVPVHVISADPVVTASLQAAGFEPGLLPAGPASGDMPWLLGRLLDALGKPTAADAVSEPATAATPAHP